MLSPLYCFLNAIVHFYGARPDSGTLAAKDMAVQPSRARVAESIGGWVKVPYTKKENNVRYHYCLPTARATRGITVGYI